MDTGIAVLTTIRCHTGQSQRVEFELTCYRRRALDTKRVAVFRTDLQPFDLNNHLFLPAERCISPADNVQTLA